MDRPPTDPAHRWPGRWRFYPHRWGFRNVIADRDERYIVSSVPAECGPLLAAGPSLLIALDKVAAQTEPGSPAHETAVNAIELFREREGMVLVDWNPQTPAPKLRIVGVAT